MTDYKNSAEGRIVTAKYQDILHLSRPEPSYRHPRMPVAGRAKIFSPFSALRGYEEEIAEEDWKNGFPSLPRRAFWKTGNLQRRLHPPAKRRKFVYNKIGILL